MAITTYSELQTAITDYMARSDLTGNVTDFIALAEARLNRLLKMVETDATLTGTAASRRIDISSLSLIQPIALFAVSNGDEVEIPKKPDGSFAYDDTAGLPSFYGLDGTNIDFDRPLDQAYTFRFRYQGRFALSVGSPTNKLLTDHPDIYLEPPSFGVAFTSRTQAKLLASRAFWMSLSQRPRTYFHKPSAGRLLLIRLWFVFLTGIGNWCK